MNTLTLQRHQVILNLLKQQGVVKLQELVQATDSSESTIRRDLIELEQRHLLKRIHGGATQLQTKGTEPSIAEKSTKNLQAKQRIAALAASLVEPGDCLYLDAGSTTLEMVPHLRGKNITVVTNGFAQLEALVEHQIRAYLLGGMMKPSTRAMIGCMALESLRNYRFDKCFLGTNGIDLELGYTTPDPDEATIKKTALRLSSQPYVVADRHKFFEVSFAKIADIEEMHIITDQLPDEQRETYQKKTHVFEVES
ncbi:DeoR/GlpR family DNA-binding transcription regulator [Laceyella putida]|uniref:DeoR/GlpR family DNA-binding transcription regulator n=1 Tax=Laceyella putida TaxID=110101 RepID=A0ABW2RFS7_9BACL